MEAAARGRPVTLWAGDEAFLVHTEDILILEQKVPASKPRAEGQMAWDKCLVPRSKVR